MTGLINVKAAIDSFQAERLLVGAYILEHIEGVVTKIAYQSNGDAISYEDMYSDLAAEVDKLPKLKLELSVPPGGESQYSIQLTMAMETVADDCDRVSHKVSKFESKIREAQGKLKRLHGEFGAWYSLAASKLMEEEAYIRLNAAQVKQLADAEFSRLTNDLDVTMESLINTVKSLRGEIKEHKRTQADKYNMGKDQVNASWTSHMPLFNGSGEITTDTPGKLLGEHNPQLEEALAPEDFVPEEPPPEKEWAFKKTGDARPIHLITDDERLPPSDEEDERV
jgi:hypothetical protein